MIICFTFFFKKGSQICMKIVIKKMVFLLDLFTTTEKPDGVRLSFENYSCEIMILENYWYY